MKRKLVLLLALLLLLSGCGTAAQPVSEAPEETALPGFGSAIPEAPSTPPTAAPTPTPEPKLASLREALPAGPRVLADGVEVESLSAQGVTLVPAEALHKIYDWIDPTPGKAVTTDGRDFHYAGSGNVLFEGQTTEYWLPLRETAEEQGLYLLWDQDEQTAYVTSPPAVSTIPRGQNVPVLMYHEVSDDLWGISSLFVSPENMRAQLTYLRDNGYDPIFFSDLTHLHDYDKPVLLTFDDGYSGNYTELFPLLQEFNMKATVFVITGTLGDAHYLTEGQVREMSESGLVSIQSHTADHYELAGLDADAQQEQLTRSQMELARITGHIPYVISYPTGSHNDTTLSMARHYYAFGIQMNGGMWKIGDDFMAIPRQYVPRGTEIGRFSALLGG